MSATAEHGPRARSAFKGMLAGWQARIERELTARLPTLAAAPARLHEAMHYSVLGGGKRVRPALVYATAAALGSPKSRSTAPPARSS